MIYALIGIHLFLCVLLTGLVLLQQGKGAELGVTLGGGSNTLFGAGGATTFITRLTTGIAIAFMITSIFLVRSYGSLTSAPSAGNDALLEGTLFEDAPAPTKPVGEGIPNAVPNQGGQVPEGASGQDTSGVVKTEGAAPLQAVPQPNSAAALIDAVPGDGAPAKAESAKAPPVEAVKPPEDKKKK